MKPTMRVLLVIYCLSVLQGCQTAAPLKPQNTEEKLAAAATSPLKDLNLIHDTFPTVVENAAKQGLSSENKKTKTALTCPEIVEELSTLTDHLGLLPGEAKKTEEKNSNKSELAQIGANEAERALVSTVKSTTQDIIPFRSLLRRLTGAQKAEEQSAKIIDASRLRKAYLLGLKEGKNCN